MSNSSETLTSSVIKYSLTTDLVERLRKEENSVYGTHPCGLLHEAADRIEVLEKGFRDILTLGDPTLMQMIARACLTGAIDDEGKYCFVPPAALGEKKDE